MQKEARKWIEYYWNYVNSDKYKEEKIKRKAEHEKATHDTYHYHFDCSDIH